MLMIILTIFVPSRLVIKILRWPLMIVMALLTLFGPYFAYKIGLSIEDFNIGGPGKGGLSNVPGEGLQQARDKTWHWSAHVGWVFWVFLAELVIEYLVYRSDKKANG